MPRPRKSDASPLEDKLFRLLGMVLFAFILYLTFIAYLALAALQWVYLVIEGRTNRELKAFTARLGTYAGEIFAYLGFATEKHPFPFSPFPKK